MAKETYEGCADKCLPLSVGLSKTMQGTPMPSVTEKSHYIPLVGGVVNGEPLTEDYSKAKKKGIVTMNAPKGTPV